MLGSTRASNEAFQFQPEQPNGAYSGADLRVRTYLPLMKTHGKYEWYNAYFITLLWPENCCIQVTSEEMDMKCLLNALQE